MSGSLPRSSTLRNAITHLNATCSKQHVAEGPDWAIFKSLDDNFSQQKVAKLARNFWAILLNITFYVEFAVTTSWSTFEKHLLLFISTSGLTGSWVLQRSDR